MSSFTYLLINLVILSGPLLLSYDKRVSYRQLWPVVAKSILPVSAFMIIWDIAATAAGHWSFSEAHTLGFRILGLPIEEILFFVTVPFSCLFVWEVINYYVKQDRIFEQLGFIWTLFGLILLAVALLPVGGEYTTWVTTLLGILLIAVMLVRPQLLTSLKTVLFLSITLILFLVFNTVLTAIPVVSYGETMITGIRIGTIPVEDALYNLFMLLGYVLSYRFFRTSL